MKNLFEKFKSIIRNKSKDDSTLSYLFKLLYRFFSHSIMQPIISILGTIIIAVLIGIKCFGLLFWISIVVYVVLIFCVALANEHTREKIKDIRHFQNALLGMSSMLRFWAVCLQQGAKKLNVADARKNEIVTNMLMEDIDFQTAAFSVCEKLNLLLTENRLSRDDVYITVFQRYKDGGKDLCKMIAYSKDHEPSSYSTVYNIPEFSGSLLGNVEYHSYVFSSGNTDVTCFSTREQIANIFKIHRNCEQREGKIQQYICIPISPAKLGITFLLQVDTTIPGLWGDDDISVNEFAKNIVYPYAQFLHMMYEQGRVFDRIIN